MTREEKASFILANIDRRVCDDELSEALDMAIKALKQQDILGKIRAEIWDLQYGDEERSMTDVHRVDVYNNAIRQGIEIIDKYKAESEENNTYQQELNDIRQDLLSRPDQYITFRDLVERFDEVDKEFNHSPWNLLQIYNNFDILIGTEGEEV